MWYNTALQENDDMPDSLDNHSQGWEQTKRQHGFLWQGCRCCSFPAAAAQVNFLHKWNWTESVNLFILLDCVWNEFGVQGNQNNIWTVFGLNLEYSWTEFGLNLTETMIKTMNSTQNRIVQNHMWRTVPQHYTNDVHWSRLVCNDIYLWWPG